MIQHRAGAANAAPARARHPSLGRWFFVVLLAVQGVCASSVPAAELQRWTGGATPALDLTGLDGQRYQLVSLRGKVVLVNFWATWCGPCRQEMPSIEQLEKKLAGRPFLALAINLDEPVPRIRTFISRTSLKLTVLLDPGHKAASEWNARVLPASFLIGPDGAIRYSVVGELDWADANIVDRISELFESNR